MQTLTQAAASYGYLSGYKKPKSIKEQTKIQRQFFPCLGLADETLAKRLVPANAEGWFAIPRWQIIAPTYSEAVENVLEVLKSARGGAFYNYHHYDQINDSRLRQTDKTASVFQKLSDEQKDYDILVVAAQFGIHHQGRSVRKAREIMKANECGLDTFSAGIMILTHPNRFRHLDDLWAYCAGDEFDGPDANVQFDRAPCFDYGDGRLWFDTCRIDYASAQRGSASVFVH